MVKKRKAHHVDYVILTTIILLVLIGFGTLATASSDLGKAEHDSPYHFLKSQLLHGLSFGVVGFLFSYHFYYRNYKKKLALFLFFASLGGVLLTFSPLGTSLGGAARWIQIGSVTVQPAEVLKIFFIMYLAAWLSSSYKGRQKSVSESFIPFLSISGIVAGILLIQRSTSAAVILMTGALAVYFIGGARKKYVFGFVGLGVLALALVISFTPYRLERIRSYINQDTVDTQDAGYQLNQAITTIGTGGVWGVGYGKSSLKSSLPERIGDSIFAIIAEEFGFAGATFVILLFLMLVLRSFMLAKRCPDEFGSLLLVGFATIIGAQAFIHIGANSGVIPLTGVPLPFISFGGTALAVFMTMGGIMLNVSRHA